MFDVPGHFTMWLCGELSVSAQLCPLKGGVKAAASTHTIQQHSCWRASFLAFCLGRRPAIYTIYIPYISFIYSMYIYNYLHIWRAARNVKNPPANNYVQQQSGAL